LLITLLVSTLSIVSGIKTNVPPPKKQRQEDASSQNNVDSAAVRASMREPGERTLQDWQTFSREALVLYAQAAHIPQTGPNLAHSLFQFYNNADTNATTTSTAPVITISPPVTNVVCISSTTQSSTTMSSAAHSNSHSNSHSAAHIQSQFQRSSFTSTTATLTPISAPQLSNSSSTIHQQIGSAIGMALQPFMEQVTSLVLASHHDSLQPQPVNINQIRQQQQPADHLSSSMACAALPTGNSSISSLMPQQPLPAIPSTVLERIRRGRPIFSRLSSSRSSPYHHSEVNLGVLYHELERFFQQSLASSTQSTYLSGARSFTKFCLSINVRPFPPTTLPLRCPLCSQAVSISHHQSLPLWYSASQFAVWLSCSFFRLALFVLRASS